MKKLLFYKLNLQLFAENGQSVGDVQTGDEIADAEQTEVNGDSEFNQLINGKFKEQFTKKTQEIIDKRFKQTKELEAYKERFSPLIKTLMEKNGISEGEEDRLLEIINNNNFDGEEKTIASSENKYRENLSRKVSNWLLQGEELKELFPDFDLRNELRDNNLFSKLLLSGVDLKTAYEVVHKNEILSGAMAYTAGKVREQIIQGIQAKGMRPQENGIIASGAVVSSVDVNALTSNDILKILKKVENGASISF